MEKQRWEESEKRRVEERRSKKESLRRKKMQVREKVEKSRFTVFFQWICGFGGSKSRLAKAAVRSRLGRWEMKNCTPLWREARFQVKMDNTHTDHAWSTFGSWDVEKVHAVVARSTFRNQNVKNNPGPDYFRKLRCLKSARRCGAKHISKWTYTIIYTKSFCKIQQDSFARVES